MLFFYHASERNCPYLKVVKKSYIYKSPSFCPFMDEDDVKGLLEALRMGGNRSLFRKERAFLAGQKSGLEDIAQRIESKAEIITQARKDLRETYHPDGNKGFFEVEGFEGYNTLQFFYDLGKFLDKSFSPVLGKLHHLQRAAANASRGDAEDDNPDSMLHDAKAFTQILKDVYDLRQEEIAPFEKEVKYVYQRAIDQFRYLQKRFLNVGGDDGRAYRDPWEEEERRGGFDLKRVPYVKTALVRENALLTDLLLDIADKLPRERTRKEKVKGKRKPKEVRYFDDFEVDRAARILVELADPTYQAYVQNPGSFLRRVASSVMDYHEVLERVEPAFKHFLMNQNDNPFVMIQGDMDALHNDEIPHPQPVIGRLLGIDYRSVVPNEEEVRPSGQFERKHFTARKALLEHLAFSLDEVGKSKEQKDGQAYEFAKKHIAKAMKLKQQLREVLQTPQVLKLDKDIKTDNEFYVGSSSGHGEFGFERETAPQVRLKDVVGKSFDTMKEHLADLANYSRYLELYAATAPRGKIRSNAIAIGPYGCGKTEIGRAIAGDPRFIGAEANITDVLTCWFGEFEKNVDRVWDAARDLRRNSGDSKLVFLLMDEFDSWFNSSSGHWVDASYKKVKKAIQIKLDGMVDYEGVIVVGFTNEPKEIPLAIYRRFKYVDIVGELEPQERTELLKKFLTHGLPLSHGFRNEDYRRWGEALTGATGDVIGKVVDEVHYEFMRKFTHEHPALGRRLHTQIRRMRFKNQGDVDRSYIKRTIGSHLLVTPDWVEQKLHSKLGEPIIQQQIETAKRVYAEARDVLAKMHTKQDVASGLVVGNEGGYAGPRYRHRHDEQI